MVVTRGFCQMSGSPALHLQPTAAKLYLRPIHRLTASKVPPNRTNRTDRTARTEYSDLSVLSDLSEISVLSDLYLRRG